MQRFFIFWLFIASSTALQAEPSSAPAFTINDDQGQQISLPRQQEGVDIYFFWATWCPYCKALMPHLQSIVDEYGDKVKIYAFNIREDGDPRAVLDAQGYDFVLVPEADALMPLYDVKGTPGLFLIDGKGNIRFNLYTLMGRQVKEMEGLNNSGKAARNAPWWAAEIRQELDRILALGKDQP